MSLTLDYDATNARVLITADGMGTADVALVERSTNQITWTTVRGGSAVPVNVVTSATDAFSRTVSNGWGSADTGQAWTTSGGAAANFSVGSGVATMAHAANAVEHYALLPLSLADVDVAVQAIPQALAVTNSYDVCLLARVADTSNFYMAQLKFNADSTADLVLQKKVGGSYTTLATATAAIPVYTAGSGYRMRLRVAGTSLMARVWSGNSEPSTWTVTASDAAITAAGQVGLRSNCFSTNANTKPFNIVMDDFAAGSAVATLYDYEFSPGVANYYRVRGSSTEPITYVGVGSSSTGSSGSRTPGAPAQILKGDVLLALAAARDFGSSANPPTGWTLLAEADQLCLLGKTYDGSEAMPTITFAGDAANQDTLAQIGAVRNATLTPTYTDGVESGSSQNIAYPEGVTSADGQLVIIAGFKMDDWTSVATVAGYTEIAEVTSTAGNDAGMVWDYWIQTDESDVPSGSFVVTGGTSINNRGLVAIFDPATYLTELTGSITADVDAVWLKSVTRPFLNRTVQVVNGPTVTVTRPARNGVSDVAGRTLPVATVDVRGSRRTTLQVRTETADDGQTLEYVIAAGDFMFIQVPYGCRTVQAGYFVIGDADETFHPLRINRRTFTLPLTEVAAPGPYVVAAESTWASVLAAYATWADVLADNPTWADLLTRRGQPSDVIVP